MREHCCTGYSPPSRPGSAVVGAERAGRCCEAAGGAADVAPWMQRSEVASQMLTQFDSSCSCPSCLSCSPCVGTLLETEELESGQGEVINVTLIKLLNACFN